MSNGYRAIAEIASMFAEAEEGKQVVDPDYEHLMLKATALSDRVGYYEQKREAIRAALGSAATPGADVLDDAAQKIREHNEQGHELEANVQRQKEIIEGQKAAIDRLADVIAREIDDEPSESEGVVDTAIRLLRKAYVTDKESLVNMQSILWINEVNSRVLELVRIINLIDPQYSISSTPNAINSAVELLRRAYVEDTWIRDSWQNVMNLGNSIDSLQASGRLDSTGVTIDTSTTAKTIETADRLIEVLMNPFTTGA